MNAGEERKPDDQKRAVDRVPMMLDVKLRVSGGKPIDARLIDLSITGFRIQFIARLHPGDRIWLGLPTLSSLPAFVAWSDGLVTGCRFENPLYAGVFDRICALAR